MRQLLGSVLFTALLFVSVVLWAVVICIAVPFGRTAQYKLVLIWLRFVLRSLKFLCRLDYTIEGKENIPETPGVAYLKHSSALETLVELIIFPQQTWVLKRELMWAPFLGWALFVLNPIANQPWSRRFCRRASCFPRHRTIEERAVGNDIPRGDAGTGGGNPPLWDFRRAASLSNRLPSRACGPQCG